MGLFFFLRNRFFFFTYLFHNHQDFRLILMMMAVKETSRSCLASMTGECSGKYLLLHKYSLTIPKGSVWGIWGMQKKAGELGERFSDWICLH